MVIIIWSSKWIEFFQSENAKFWKAKLADTVLHNFFEFVFFKVQGFPMDNAEFYNDSIV